jgi:hypothetical protein
MGFCARPIRNEGLPLPNYGQGTHNFCVSRSCVANRQILQSDINVIYFLSPKSLFHRLLRQVSLPAQPHRRGWASSQLLPKGIDEIHEDDGSKEIPQHAPPSVPYGWLYAHVASQFDSVSTAPGCRRLIVDPGYLECLHRPNVTLTYDAIECIVPSGVQLETGKVIPLDVIIFGTGFELVRQLWIGRPLG